MRQILLAAVLAAASAHSAPAQTAPVKIGFVSTFSGPGGQLGQEVLDGFRLGLKAAGGTLGGRQVEVLQGDDQAKPDVGRQIVDKMIESDRVQILTGFIFSNVMLAVAKPVLDAGAFLISVNAGPSAYAGKQCHPHYFVASFQNDTVAEAMGLALTKKGVKKMYLLAPNYPAGKDFLAGFKRTFKGEIAGEVYTTFGQLDYAAEIAQLRAAKPEGVFFFYPGGMGINFVKQYGQAGMRGEVPLYGPSFSFDQTVLPGMGEAAMGAIVAAAWAETFDDPASVKFVADFEAAYGRIPSSYAANAYDTALILDAALMAIGGRIEDRAAFQKALETAKAPTVRASFRFNTNHYPVQDFYLAEVVKDARGRMVQQRGELIVGNLGDSYAVDCKMPAIGLP